MRLNLFADYGLRALIFLAVHRDERVTTEELADAYGLSQAHLRKIVRRLGELGFVSLYRGREGGLELAVEPADVSIGKSLRALESDSPLVECFDPATDQCVISPACALKAHLARAERAFYAELDGVTLEDVLKGSRAARLRKLLSG